ncbi:MAG: HAD family hydrolase [bacterium]|nr:HAD family hydrolase [bacterium]
MRIERTMAVSETAKEYQNFVFDLYGTLVDIHTDEEKRLVWEKMCLFYGYHGAVYTADEMRESYVRLVREQERQIRFDIQMDGHGSGRKARCSHEAFPEVQLEIIFSELFKEKGVEADAALVLHAGQFFRALSTEYIRLYQGVPEMLQALRRMGKRMYLLTNAQRVFTEYELKFLDIARYFDGILISSDYGVKKPDVRFFECLLNQYHLEPDTCIMIGNDGTSDVAGAKTVGMDTFYLHSNLSPQETGVKATYVQDEMNIELLCRRLGIDITVA